MGAMYDKAGVEVWALRDRYWLEVLGQYCWMADRVKAILVDRWVKATYVSVHDLLVVGSLVVQLDGIGVPAKKGFTRVHGIHDVD